MNRNLDARITLEQLSALYTDPESHNAQRHRHTDGRTDRRTDGQQAYANSRSYCVAVRSAKNTGTRVCFPSERRQIAPKCTDLHAKISKKNSTQIPDLHTVGKANLLSFLSSSALQSVSSASRSFAILLSPLKKRTNLDDATTVICAAWRFWGNSPRAAPTRIQDWQNA